VPEHTAKLKASSLRLCFSNGWRMRNDGARVVLYKYSTEESEWRVIPPRTALALTLFNGKDTLNEVALRLGRLAELSPRAAKEFLTELVAVFHVKDPILVESETMPDRDWCLYAPDEMIIPVSEFDPSKRFDAPLSLLLMPFNGCDVDCKYCYSERRPIPDACLLSTERWVAILNEAADAGVCIATFSGGDPMLHPGIMEIMDVLVERDFAFLMSTKSLISDDTAGELADMGIGSRLFQISLDAWTPDLADHMVRSSGYRERSVRSIRNLVRHGIRVRTNTVCTPENVHEAPTLVRRLQDLGVSKSSVTIYGRSMYRHSDALFLPPDKIDWLREQIDVVKQEMPEADISFNGSLIDHNAVPRDAKEAAWESRAHCSGGITSMTLCADGRVILCEQMPQSNAYTAGSVAEHGLLEVWHSDRMRELAHPGRAKFKDTVCFDCEEFDKCHQETGYCFRDALNVYGTVYMPPPNCPQAPPSKRLA